MKRSQQRVLTTFVGSLIRPPELRELQTLDGVDPHRYADTLRAVVDLLLRVNAGAYAIEAGNPRHAHEWKVPQHTRLPEAKILIPGTISHCTPVVEHRELVAERIVRYAQLVGRDNLIAGSDCGFAHSQGLSRVPPSIMWAKLRALVDGARLASEELFQ